MGIVCVVILAVLSNCNEWDEIYYFATTHKKWLKSFLKLTGGIPQSSTYERVISMIDSHELNNLCVEFMIRLVEFPINSEYDFYHIDGKVEKGDYVGALNGNQGSFYQDVIDYFDEDKLMIIQSGYEGAYKEEIEKSHSQVIKYEYYQTEDIKWYEDVKSWKGLKSIGLVVKAMENKKGEKVVEKRYYISSLLIDIYNFSKAIRNHWNVENKLHWQLDFTFKSDDNTTVNKKALFNLQIINKFDLNILNQVKEGYKCSLKKIGFQISLNAPEELERIFKLMNKRLKN